MSAQQGGYLPNANYTPKPRAIATVGDDTVSITQKQKRFLKQSEARAKLKAEPYRSDLYDSYDPKLRKELTKLVRMVGSAFYSDDCLLILDVLSESPWRLDLLQIALDMGSQQLQQVIDRLKDDKLVVVEDDHVDRKDIVLESTLPEGQKRLKYRQYRFRVVAIDFAEVFNVVSFKLLHMRKAIEETAENEAPEHMFKCPYCGTEYSMMDAASSLLAPDGTLRCENCDEELVENTQSDEAGAVHARKLMGEIQPFVSVLETVKRMVPSGEIAMPNLEQVRHMDFRLAEDLAFAAGAEEDEDIDAMPMGELDDGDNELKVKIVETDVGRSTKRRDEPKWFEGNAAADQDRAKKVARTGNVSRPGGPRTDTHESMPVHRRESVVSKASALGVSSTAAAAPAASAAPSAVTTEASSAGQTPVRGTDEGRVSDAALRRLLVNNEVPVGAHAAVSATENGNKEGENTAKTAPSNGPSAAAASAVDGNTELEKKRKTTKVKLGGKMVPILSITEDMEGDMDEDEYEKYMDVKADLLLD
eukprot:Clim_evm45s202 gene=Clim_evmTU45s202